MANIIEEKLVTLRTEAVAPRIVILWNPLDNSGSVHFRMEALEYQDEAYVRTLPLEEISITLEQLSQRTVEVAGNPVPMLLVMGYIKQLLADLYAERTAPPAE